eukprot:3277429-Alexandrium_andersonii.AAC.1
MCIRDRRIFDISPLPLLAAYFGTLRVFSFAFRCLPAFEVLLLPPPELPLPAGVPGDASPRSAASSVQPSGED